MIHDFNLLSHKIHFQLEIFTEGFARKFVMILDFKEGRLSAIISMVSLCSMEAYLFSYITDKMLYNFLDLPMPLMTFLSLVLALICAYVLKKFTNPVVKILKEKYILLVTKKIKEPQ